MRVAAIYDIHGNLPALEAVIREVRDSDVDRIVVGGDILPGPMPLETLECLLNLEIPVQFILGNCEIDILTHWSGQQMTRVPESVQRIMLWSAERLQPKYAELLAAWPKSLRLEIAGIGSVMFCHATPRDDNEIFTCATSEERLLPIFEGLSVDLVVCGHTHMQFDRKVGKTRVVNAGSVGMPFGEPGAYWVLLGPEIELRRTDYDLKSAAEAIRRTKYPQAFDFAEKHVLNAPAAESVLDLYSKAELKVFKP
jgi:putative phosphoesterase